jgi:hypothetical protein
VPLPVLKSWIDESYRKVAPKALLRALEDEPERPAARRGRKRAGRLA